MSDRIHNCHASATPLGADADAQLARRHFGLADLVAMTTILIAVLAVGLPIVFEGVRKAESVTCMKNLDALSTWSSMYASENDYHLPSYETGWIDPIADRGDRNVITREAPANEFNCPSQPFVSPIADVGPSRYWRGTNYGINQHLASDLTRPGGQRFPEWSNASIRSFSDAARKVIFADASGSNYFNTPDRDPTVAGLSQFGGTYVDAMMPNPARPLPSLRHLGNTANFLFADGHAESKSSFPMFMNGRGTGGFEFWHAEHWYPESGMEPPAAAGLNAN